MIANVVTDRMSDPIPPGIPSGIDLTSAVPWSFLLVVLVLVGLSLWAASRAVAPHSKAHEPDDAPTTSTGEGVSVTTPCVVTGQRQDQ